jgi:hypothetical protein
MNNLAHLRNHGPTERAFSWEQLSDAKFWRTEDAPNVIALIPREKVDRREAARRMRGAATLSR